MSLNWTDGPLALGLECYRAGEFFEAHEHWELVWLELCEPEKSFLQALIQVSAAFHHYRRGNVMGAISLLTRALRRLERCDAHFAGIAVEKLRAGVRAKLRGLEVGEVPDGVPEIGLES
jgi:predicted metal-dependent hydrolase